ncbi:Ig-like domain-containing protein [Protaetiibacter intestinalis]|uniref:Tandem-95 repeat protein n=1 Tax=Protaetiibacter intestinalis TaxID=2419774 RepID=A0A387B5D1_9MICO|nr:Ig-like domain-containing protein [Protaetiibacter intestinalis]AYF98832.1 tandem-95 repeat protein [Protaetiibacter intestinalis]
MSWLSTHRSLVATATSGTVVAALVATLAVVSTGYTAQRMDLSDPSVWVVGGDRQAIGRANTEVLELDSVIPTDAEDAQLVQSGSTVLLVDGASATVQRVDPVTSTLGDDIALPPQQPELFLAGDRVVVFAQATGEVWLVPLTELDTFDAASPSTLSLGEGAVVTVTGSGALLAYVPETSEVWRVEPGELVVGDRTGVGWDAARSDDVQLTAVGEDWAVLDTTIDELATASGVHELGSLAGTNQRLQAPGPADSRVLVADSASLLAVPLGGGDATVLADDVAGVPVAPVVVDGCRFAAWTSGALWRTCGSDDSVRFALSGMPGNPALAFAVNGGRVTLNDTASGASWAIQSDGELIDNWDDLILDDDEQQEQPEADDETPPELEEVQQPPVAVDDEMGARPGRASVLPVLLNDYDPNGDVLVVTSFDPIDEALGRLDLVSRNQQLQLTLTDGASGVIRFRYTISDGRGGTASAEVTVTVRSPEENSPPQAVRTSTATVASGGRVSTQVLGDWFDPDGDAIYLTAASIAAPDQVGFKPDGVVVFTDGGEGTGMKTVALTVSDGRAVSGGSLQVTVRPRGEVPILVEPWVALASAGEEITVRPMQHVRGGNATIRLGGVPPKAGTTIVPSFEAGTFTFLSDDVRTHYIEFTVTDGTQTVTGFVRIDVSAPADASTRPITVPKTIFMTLDSTQTVDPPTTDIDPAGGVLVVTGVMNIPAGSGIVAEVLDQRRVRVTLNAPLDTPVSFNYRISNGLAETEGTITVVEIPSPQRLQPPIATDDQVTVRVGDAIDISVLDNDEQPDGAEITLLPDLAVELPEDGGLLFVADDRLRYLAPQTAGNYSAVYAISGPDGQVAQARVLISVRERNAATNNPPVPRTVTARVLAGQTVHIDIPTSGVDPDGDAVQLIGQTTNPEKGSVVSVDGNSIQYQAGDYSSGTDVFQYAVVDGLGARATGTIRVGISPALEGARNPVANIDTVTVRPGRTVSVRALLNDSDPDGSVLRIRQVEPNDDVTKAQIVGDDVVRITPPSVAGDYSVVYTIENDTGGTSSNFIRVTVSPDAPLARPNVTDTVLSVTDVLERETVDVSVLERAFWADGDVSELGVELVPGFSESAEVLANKRVRVTIGDRSQIIPFAVFRPDEPTIRAYAFIRVPGYDDALPQINTKAPPLKVESESTVRIELSQYVVALGGSKVRLTDSSTVRATHSDGSSLVVDEDTLEFTSADRYWGPASISFEVTDGTSATDPDGHVTTLSLPIEVTPRENQPPIFSGGVVEFEPGQQKELDLVKLTKYPYDDDIDELTYAVLEPLPVGFSYQINGQRLLLTADASAVKGSTTSITLSVRDALNEGQSGRVELRVVPSTRPLARPIADQAIARRGETTVVDVLANDAATNPFPDVPLRVVDIRGLSGATLPAGISITPSADRSKLSVTVADAAEPLDTTLQYQVADATGDADRYVWGTVTISVQDVPDPVTNLRVTEFGDRTLKLGWSPGPFNNSAITEYRVTMTNAATGSTLSTTSCTVTVGCAVTTPGNGPSNAVRFTVVAINAIGESLPSELAGSIWSDVIPPPPSAVTATPVDHGLRVTWRKPATTSGSPVDSYVVTVAGVAVSVTVDPADAVGTEYSKVVSQPGIANGAVAPFSVSARNKAPNSLATWNEAGGTGTPAGAPIVTASPAASASTTDGTTVSVAWPGAFADNGKAISAYYVALHDGTPPECTVTGVESGSPTFTPPSGSNVQQVTSGTSATFGGLTPNTSYTLTVYAYNGQGCTASAPVTATPRAAPGKVVLQSGDVTGLVASGTGTWDFQLNGLHIPEGSADVDSFVYRLSGGTTDTSASAPTPFGAFLTAGTSHYGNQVSVEVKACRQYTEVLLCSQEWSDPVVLGRAVRIQLDGLQAVETAPPMLLPPAPGTGYWSWTGGPVVGAPGYDTVSFGCGPDDDTSTPQCEVVGGGLTGDAYPDLVVTVSSDGADYTRTYSWTDIH